MLMAACGKKGVGKSYQHMILMNQYVQGDYYKGLKGRKITWEQGNVGQPSSPINQYDLKGNFIKKWDSIKEPSLIYKCYVSGCLRGRQKSAGGYIWKYADK